MLSGGQRQRLAIARALLRDAPILILDEALSSVDAENEAVIQQAIDRLAAGRTTLVLAHRLSSVIGADRILVLDKGRVVEEGRHAELIRRDGPYRRLMGAQAEEREGDIALAEDADEPDAAGEREQIELAAETAPAELANAAAAVGWPATLGTLWSDHHAVAPALRGRRRLRHRPRRRLYRGRHSQRARRRRGQDRVALWLSADPVGLGRPARRAAALARILARPRHRLSAVGGNADRAVRQARPLGAGLSDAAALGRSDRARQPGRRNRRVFLCPHRGAGVGRGAGAVGGADRAGGCRLADRAGAVAVRPVRGAGAGGDAGADRPAGGRRRAMRSGCSAPTSPRRSRASPTSSRFRRSPAAAGPLWSWCAATRRSGWNCWTICRRRRRGSKP